MMRFADRTFCTGYFWGCFPSKHMRHLTTLLQIIALTSLSLSGAFGSTRIKDLVSIEGVRDNQLVGYGVVVGLAATGDKQQTVFTVQSLTSILKRMGVTVSPTAVTVKNTASVLVTATLPPFAQPGSKIDVTVAAIGDASNLQGGLLILTPLKSAGGQIFAIAQGAVVTGGFLAGRGGNTQTVNHPTVGRVIEGRSWNRLRRAFNHQIRFTCSFAVQISSRHLALSRRSIVNLSIQRGTLPKPLIQG